MRLCLMYQQECPQAVQLPCSTESTSWSSSLAGGEGLFALSELAEMVAPDPWACAKEKDRYQQAEIVGMERNSLFSDRWSVASFMRAWERTFIELPTPQSPFPWG